MQKQRQQQLQQSNVTVATQANSTLSARLWWLTLVSFFAGVFYFYGFWYKLWWRVLAGE
jgi:hypothetical protein